MLNDANQPSTPAEISAATAARLSAVIFIAAVELNRAAELTDPTDMCEAARVVARRILATCPED